MTHDLGVVAMAGGDRTCARSLFEDSLQTARTHGFEPFEAGVLGSLGYLELEEGRIDRADELLKRDFTLSLDLDVVDLSTAHDLYAFAKVTALRGDPRSASVLVGATDAAFSLKSAAREPIAERARIAALSRAEEVLGRDAVDRAYAEGEAMSLVEAVEYALSLD